MSVRLSFGQPVIVAQGPTWEEAGWGSHQFPAIRALPDGRLALAYHIVNDRAEDYGLERGWAVSSDGGESWATALAEELPAIKARFGTRLPSGRYLRAVTPKPFKISEELYRSLERKIEGRQYALGVEEIPDGLFEKDKWLFALSEADSLRETEFFSELEFPGMTLSLTGGAIIRPFPFGPVKTAPDGSVWVAHYWHGRDPHNLGYTSYYACYYFRSTDEGRSFHLQSWIQYKPHTGLFLGAFLAEGFCEPDICFMPDGSMITLLRTGGSAPSFLARSADGGRSWSEPVLFDRCGVFPQLLRLDCGVTLASYGRPGLYVRASSDPSGLAWETPYELMPYDPQRITRDSCCYTGLVALDERTALLAYTDFNVPDASGVKRKSVMVRKVRVEAF